MTVSIQNKSFKITDEISFLEFKKKCDGLLSEPLKLTILDSSAPNYYLLGYLLLLQKRGIKIDLAGEEKGIQLIRAILLKSPSQRS